MPKRKEHLIELIINKLNKNSRKIHLEKKEFLNFINFLINNN